MKATAPTYLTATCIVCGCPRTFELSGGSEEDLVGVYHCEDCGHQTRLLLDP